MKFILLLALAACGNHRESERVTYHDRNHDGRIDLEKHVYPGAADRDWNLSDTDHDGRYDKKTIFGFSLQKVSVSLPVPENVRITRTP